MDNDPKATNDTTSIMSFGAKKNTRANTEVVQFRDLEAIWYLPRAKEPGFMRWLVTWVGGPAGFINPSIGSSVISENMAVGFMSLPRGQRQSGLHAHTVAEIYVILKGRLMGWDGRGENHIANTGDCVYIPAGVPHGVRCYGSEDAELIWIHDNIERKDAVTYFTGPGPYPQSDDIKVIRYKDLEPSYDAPRCKEPEFMRWNISYVGGPHGFTNHNPEQAALSRSIHIGVLALDPAQKEVPFSADEDELYILLDHEVVVSAGSEQGRSLERLDGVFFRRGEMRAVRNYGRKTVNFLTVRPFG
ncbi:hypothetical protein HBI92_030420 [Parastagonospora nodorum]|nr:hypothetical protein HBI09_204740 [Parastagonospora nodorum]KAH5487336.1 hypothetical protein HBI29_217410 [Parastagonospora nodorum]KAH5881126.1 hypothetical protein HBI91_020780 [Parastagonospora nodorum]KAH5905139.1 hypothetical protein HBI92_030420 [Parastagonospora nodorum]KAH5977528.1 hypothetical protein HBI85_001140 [Parastagonospora nodorum]